MKPAIRRVLKRGLKGRFLANMRRTSPLLLVRLAFSVTVLFPFLMLSLVMSWSKMRRWRKAETCQQFLRRHAMAFEGLDIDSLAVESRSGGVSNSNQVWRLQKKGGGTAEYFVKVFISAGTFWARHLSWVAPFPSIYHQETHERFTVDMVSRVELERLGVPVPRLVAFDAVQKVMVTELLAGRNVDDVLNGIAERDSMTEEDRMIITECARGLAAVHDAGYALVDTQPVNCIWEPESRRVYFTDLEFCTREDFRAWDVGYFLCFLVLRLSGETARSVRHLFLASYENLRHLDHEHVRATVDRFRDYIPVLQTILDVRQFTPEELLEELTR